MTPRGRCRRVRSARVLCPSDVTGAAAAGQSQNREGMPTMAVHTFELVDYEVKDRTAWITINNAERMNALSTGVQNGLYDAFEA